MLTEIKSAAYKQGIDSFCESMLFADSPEPEPNPYRRGTDEYHDWNDGWNDTANAHD